METGGASAPKSGALAAHPPEHGRLRVIKPASFMPSAIWTGIRELMDYRDLLLAFTIHRIEVRYRQSILGLAWAILQPLTLMMIYTVIFSYLVHIPSNGPPYALFSYAALVPWTFFLPSIVTSASSLVAQKELVTKVYFPREIMPFTCVFAALFDLLMACLVLACMMLAYHTHVTAQIFMAIPIVLLAAIFVMAVSLVLSAFQVRFRDIGLAMPLVLQIVMYATPVVYPFSMVPQRFRALYVLNPMVGIIENFRRVTVQGLGVDYMLMLPGLIVMIVFLPLAYLYFKRAEANMADAI